MGWQWHQLDNMEAICISLQTDDHTNTSSLLQAGRSSWRPTNNVKALKGRRRSNTGIILSVVNAKSKTEINMLIDALLPGHEGLAPASDTGSDGSRSSSYSASSAMDGHWTYALQYQISNTHLDR